MISVIAIQPPPPNPCTTNKIISGITMSYKYDTLTSACYEHVDALSRTGDG